MDKRLVVRMIPVQELKTEIAPKMRAQVVDISDRGVQIEVASPLAPKSAFDLRFQVHGQDLVLRVRVRRCKVWRSVSNEAGSRTLLYRAGLEFTKPQPGLTQFLSSEISLKPAG
jgi:hypothetical protein